MDVAVGRAKNIRLALKAIPVTPKKWRKTQPDKGKKISLNKELIMDRFK